MSQPGTPDPAARPGGGPSEPSGGGGSPAPTGGGGPDHAADSDLSESLSRLAESDLDPAERRRLLGRVAASSGRGAVVAMTGPRAAVRWALDTLTDVVPRLRVRDLAALRAHHPGLDGEDLADALVRRASRVTAGVGAAGGGIAAVEWVAPPTLLSAPVLVAVETVAVVAVEVKLIAELHEVYGVPVPGTGTDRASRLLQAWAQRRGVTLLHPAKGFSTVLGAGMRKELRDRLVKRMGRNLTSLAPLFAGAVVAGELNRRATRTVGEQVRRDLRRRVIEHDPHPRRS